MATKTTKRSVTYRDKTYDNALDAIRARVPILQIAAAFEVPEICVKMARQKLGVVASTDKQQVWYVGYHGRMIKKGAINCACSTTLKVRSTKRTRKSNTSK